MIEMLTTVAVLAVSLALAAPALSGFIRSNRVRAAQSELVSSLTLARSEAARLGTPVGIESKKPEAEGGFARGWRVWVDTDADGSYTDGEPLLRDIADLGASVVITTREGDPRRTVFSPRGFVAGLTRRDIKVCSASDDPKGYRVQLAPVGLADISPVPDPLRQPPPVTCP